MKRTPCEYIVWNILPSIRNEIVRSLIKDFGLNQKEAAERLGITPAAVCLYLSDKRGNIKIKDEKIIKEIRISTEKIIKNKKINIVNEICRICKIIKSKESFTFSNPNDKVGELLLIKF